MGKEIDLTGRVFERLTVLRRSENDSRYWICHCKCGNDCTVLRSSLTRGLTKSCGCLNRELVSRRCLVDLTGKTFGRLTVLRRADKNASNGNPRWVCQCSCQDRKIVEVTGWNLTRGITRSCGCIKREIHTKWKTPEEKSLLIAYHAMKQRCYDKNYKDYARWGGRGITICDEWLNNKEVFIRWALTNGFKLGLTIDRIDNDGPYAPWNCRWVDRIVQANNRRSNLYITVNGITHSLADWARMLNVNYIKFWKKNDWEIIDMIREYLSKRVLPDSS